MMLMKWNKRDKRVMRTSTDKLLIKLVCYDVQKKRRFNSTHKIANIFKEYSKLKMYFPPVKTFIQYIKLKIVWKSENSLSHWISSFAPLKFNHFCVCLFENLKKELAKHYFEDSKNSKIKLCNLYYVVEYELAKGCN